MPDTHTIRYGPTVPARRGVVITPHDTNNLPEQVRGIYVGAAGNVAVILADDTAALTFTGLVPGICHPLSCKRILATGTTATGIIGIL